MGRGWGSGLEPGAGGNCLRSRVTGTVQEGSPRSHTITDPRVLGAGVV